MKRTVIISHNHINKLINRLTYNYLLFFLSPELQNVLVEA
jgi:hypothetical protein